MATYIIYNGEQDAVSGLEWDRPSAELLKGSFPSATILSAKGVVGLDLTSSFQDVDSLINLFEFGAILLCVGGEDVLGISKQLTEKGYVDKTPEVQNGTGFYKSLSYNGRIIVIMTGGCCNTPIEQSRMGTINAAYLISQSNLSNFPLGVGENFEIAPGPDRLGLYSIELSPQYDKSELLKLCSQGYFSSALESILTDSGFPSSTFKTLRCYIENNKLNMVVIEFGSPNPLIIVLAVGLIVLGALYLIKGIVTADDVTNQESERTEQVTQEAIKQKYEDAKLFCEANPGNECATLISKLSSDDVLIAEAKAKAEEWKSKQASGTKGTFDQATDFLKTAAVIGALGIGVYFLFSSGLFTAGKEAVQKRLAERKMSEASRNAKQK